MKTDKKNYSRQFIHPVVLLSVADGHQENLATMAWVSPVSFQPPLLMVSVSPKRHSHDMIHRAKEFGIIVLSDKQKELSTLAGTRSGRNENKWEIDVIRQARKEARIISAPLLTGCRACYECKLESHLTTGDHTLFIGKVLRYEINEQVMPLLLFNRNYHAVGEFIARYP